jgi:tetratricopeptide (TPR) repeat protein
MRKTIRVSVRFRPFKKLTETQKSAMQALLSYRQRRFPEAQEKVTETLKIYRKSYGVHYDSYPTALITQGLILNQTGEPQAAETTLREALKLRSDSLSPEHFWVVIAKSALAECLITQGRFAESEAAAE